MEETRETQENEFYTNAFKSWMDLFKSKNGAAKGFIPPFIKSSTDMNKALFQGLTSSLTIYDTWLKNVDDIIGESFDLSQNVIRGEDAKEEKLLETVKDAYANMTAAVTDSFEDTPFKEMAQIGRTMKTSAESFSNGGNPMEKFFQESFGLGKETMNLFRSSNKETTEVFFNILKGKFELSETSYQHTTDSYKKLFSHITEMFQHKTANDTASEKVEQSDAEIE
jgi:hypothetical protein